MQAYIESLICFGSIRSKLPTFLNQSWSICGWTVLSLIITLSSVLLVTLNFYLVTTYTLEFAYGFA